MICDVENMILLTMLPDPSIFALIRSVILAGEDTPPSQYIGNPFC